MDNPLRTLPPARVTGHSRPAERRRRRSGDQQTGRRLRAPRQKPKRIKRRRKSGTPRRRRPRKSWRSRKRPGRSERPSPAFASKRERMTTLRRHALHAVEIADWGHISSFGGQRCDSNLVRAAGRRPRRQRPRRRRLKRPRRAGRRSKCGSREVRIWTCLCRRQPAKQHHLPMQRKQRQRPMETALQMAPKRIMLALSGQGGWRAWRYRRCRARRWRGSRHRSCIGLLIFLLFSAGRLADMRR